MASSRMMLKGDFSAIRKMAQKIEGLSLQHQDAVLVKGMDSATKKVSDSARTLAPKDEGDLKKSMGNAVRKYNGGDLILGFMGPQRGYFGPGKRKSRVKIAREPGQSVADYNDANAGEKRPEWYAHLVEYGHYSAGATGKSVSDGTKGTRRRRGTFPTRSFVRAQPFLRPAFSRGQAQLENDLANTTAEAMDNEFKKLSKT